MKFFLALFFTGCSPVFAANLSAPTFTHGVQVGNATNALPDYFVKLVAVDGMSANYSFTFPADGGTSGQSLLTDGSGGTSWGAIGIAGGGTGNTSLPVTAGGVIYSDGTKLDNTGAGTSGYILKSTGSGAPAWLQILPIANGGTNSSTSLNNNRVMQSSSGSIVEAAAITASRALVSDSNGIPTHATTTATEIGYVNGVTSAIQTQLDDKQLRSTLTAKGDLYVATASNTVARQGVGTNSHLLMADSAQTNGIKWAQADLTASVTGVLPIANGGTNVATLGTSGGVLYYDGSGVANTGLSAGGGTTAYALTHAGTGQVPSWSTALVYGTFSPTLTNGTNTQASTTHAGTYIRVGSVVDFCFTPDWDPTSTGLTLLGISIPFSSTLGASTDATGVCTWAGGTTDGKCICYADPTNHRVECSMIAVTTSNASTRICIQYVIN